MPRRKKAKFCECGCGEMTAGGDFRPGHDSKTLSAILDHVGGVIELRKLIESVTNKKIIVHHE